MVEPERSWFPRERCEVSWEQVVVPLEDGAAKDSKGSCRCGTTDEGFLLNDVFFQRKTLNKLMKRLVNKPYSFKPNQIVL